MQFELLLKGAHVIDPKNSVDVVCDVAIEAGKIAAVDKDIPTAQAKKIIQVDDIRWRLFFLVLNDFNMES